MPYKRLGTGGICGKGDGLKISFVVPSISSTVLGVVTNHAKILSRVHEVQIVGPDMGGGVCPLYEGVWPYTIVNTPRLYRLPEFISSVRRISDAVEGDVVIAVKSFAQTIMPALRQQRVRGKKIMLYLDEWDGALYYRLPLYVKCAMWMKHAHHPTGEHYVPFMERQFKRFDRILCSTQWLANRFHGDVVHFGVDTDQFDPEKVIAVDDTTWSQLGLDGKKVLIFGGVVRPHKGVEEILNALKLLRRDDLRLLIAGPLNEHVRDLMSRPGLRKWMVCSGEIRKDDMPRWLKRADVVVVPLKDDMLGQTQMPCKVFEAMSMGKPIITADVCDLKKVLGNSAVVVPTGDIDDYAQAIKDVCDNLQMMQDRGRLGRELCIRNYSAAATALLFRKIMEP